MLRLRKGETTVEDWKLVLPRQPSNVTNLCDFEDATRPFFSNECSGDILRDFMSRETAAFCVSRVGP